MSLAKYHRLKSRKAISSLFQRRKSLRKNKLKVYFKSVNRPDNAAKILFTVSVPKKLIKTAVKRNLLKRRIREAFRLHQSLLNDKLGDQQQLHFMVIYTSKEVVDYHEISKDLIFLLNKV